MQPTTPDFTKLFTDLIKKQMLILGPDITLAKVRKVTGLTVSDAGEVQKIEGSPQVVLQEVVNQFMELSGLIVKKTVESILVGYPSVGNITFGNEGITSAASAPVPTQPVMDSLTVVSENKTEEAPMTVKPAVVMPEPVSVPDIATNPLTEVKDPVQVAPQPTEASVEDHVREEGKEDANSQNFSQKEMDDLNKALENLSSQPLANEAPKKPDPVVSGTPPQATPAA